MFFQVCPKHIILWAYRNCEVQSSLPEKLEVSQISLGLEKMTGNDKHGKVDSHDVLKKYHAVSLKQIFLL